MARVCRAVTAGCNLGIGDGDGAGGSQSQVFLVGNADVSFQRMIRRSVHPERCGPRTLRRVVGTGGVLFPNPVAVRSLGVFVDVGQPALPLVSIFGASSR